MLRLALGLLVVCVLTTAAHARPGRVDSSFGTKGTVRFDEGAAATDVLARRNGTVAVRTDDGALRTLRAGGTSATPAVQVGNLLELEPAPGGFAALSNTGGAALVRLGAAGEVAERTALGAEDLVGYDLVRRPGGGWLVHAARFEGALEFPVLAALTATGAIDEAFAPPALLPRAEGEDSRVAVDLRGRIHLVTTAPFDCDEDARPALVVRRFSAGGTHDERYGPRRLRLPPVPGFCASTQLGDVLTDRRGRLLVGYALPGEQGRVLRLRASGRRDRSFGRRGEALSRVGPEAPLLALAPGGRIAAAGTAGRDYPRVAVARLLGSGRMDPRFGRVLARSTEAFPGSLARDLAVDRRGRVLVAGTAYDNYGDPLFREDFGGDPHAAVWRFRARR